MVNCDWQARTSNLGSFFPFARAAAFGGGPGKGSIMARRNKYATYRRGADCQSAAF
jgi:hypothetical protein